ncbi:MAG TPA: pantoate--beta-alanine ligase, partial [Anaerolineales bacterium]|nr:pantoate--beta-alanine ligase [Anaerolineales bacterium]
RGVTTVVAKLFNAVQPQKAYFGQKDAQQVAVIQQMVRDLNFPIEIVVCPTMRELDGLALSSRNAYLIGDERHAATVLYRALKAAKSAYQSGERSANALRHLMAVTIRAEPLTRMQYVSCAHPLTLKELDSVEQDVLFSMAVYVGRTRLIDNFLLEGGVWTTG